VLDHFFNLTKNLIPLEALRFNTTFDNLALAYFFGPPCIRGVSCNTPAQQQ